MSPKKRLPKSVHEKMEYLEYEDQLNPKEKEFIEQFYDEYYNDGVSFTHEDDRILTTTEMIQEARRNHNNNKRDAFAVARKMNSLEYDPADTKEFMEAASDEWDWQNAYSRDGYEASVDVIFNQALRDLMNKIVEKKVTLARFYVKMELLRKEFNIETRKMSKKRKKKRIIK